MSNDFPRGRFVWLDLMTSDPAAAQKFYTQLIGWGIEVWDGAGTPYSMWTNGGTSLGGVMQLPAEAQEGGAVPHWLAHIATPDVDETVDTARDLGATVMVPPTDIPTVGRFAVLADPQGAVFAAFTPESTVPGHDDRPAVGEFSWHELATTDQVAAFDFYHRLFGWQKATDFDMGEMGIYQMYGRFPDVPLGGIFTRPKEMPVNAWLHYVRVPDVRPAVEKVKELGGQVVNGPMEVPGGDLIAQCLDPQGAMFALHSAVAT